MKENIKLVPNFIPEEDRNRLIEFIDGNLDRFHVYSMQENYNRYALRFGRDQVWWDSSDTYVHGLEEINDLVHKYFDLVPEKLKEVFGDESDIYPATFWLAKQQNGAFVKAHHDAHPDINKHFKYSVIIYLNSNEDGGELFFPFLHHTIKPSAGDLVTFPSHGNEYLHEVTRIAEDRYSMLFWITGDKELSLPKP